MKRKLLLLLHQRIPLKSYLRAHYFTSKQLLPIPHTDLKRHTFIVGQSGSGKSELMKLLFYKLQFLSQKKRQYSLILLDPHGDLATQILSFDLNVNSDRLIYIDPYLDSAHTPCINPFDLKHKSEEVIDKMAQGIKQVIQESLKGDSSFSMQMDTILKPCIATLLRKPQTQFSELLRFMDDAHNQDLIALGKQSPLPAHRTFFEQQFSSSGYQKTKIAIFTRLQNLLNSYTFYNLLEGQSTLDIETSINQGKVLLFSLAKGRMGEEESPAYGRFLLNTLKNITFQRVNLPPSKRKPVYVMIDECHHFFGESFATILSESRKFGLHLIFASQHLGKATNRRMEEELLSNTAVKIMGTNSVKTQKKLASEVAIKMDTLPLLSGTMIVEKEQF